jgi:hypothetical protein
MARVDSHLGPGGPASTRAIISSGEPRLPWILSNHQVAPAAP